MAKRQHAQPPASWSRPEEALRKLVAAIAGMLRGKTNNTADVTLTPSSTTTVVSDALVSPDSLVFLVAKSASAASATGVWVEVTAGQVTIHHDSNAATDRDFGLAVIG